MDFESLLRRYMRHVIGNEGTAFTYGLKGNFTEAEAAYLDKLGDELEEEANPPTPARDGPPLRMPTFEEQQATMAKMAESALRAFQTPNAFMQPLQTPQAWIAQQLQPKLDAEQQEWLDSFRLTDPPRLVR